MVFPTFFNISLNFAIWSLWSESVSFQVLFYWLYRASPSLAAKNIVSLIWVMIIWWCLYIDVSWVVKKKKGVYSMFSWQNCVSLCSASLCTPRSTLLVIPSIFWLPAIAFQLSLIKNIFGCNSRRCCKSLHSQSTSASLASVVGT